MQLDLAAHPFRVQFGDRVVHCSNFALLQDIIENHAKAVAHNSMTGSQIYPNRQTIQ